MKDSELHGRDKRGRSRRTLPALCLGLLIIAMTSTSVNVALSSLALDLKLTERSLVWIVNAYLLTFGGLLLVGGRLGDIFGHERIFVIGIFVFTLGSFGCGIAGSAQVLIAGRAVQGAGAAMASAAALSVIATVFTAATTRARALSVRAAVGASGGSAGLLFGGFLTSALGWRGLFLASGLLGACACALCHFVLPSIEGDGSSQHLDAAGGLTVTASLMLVSYVIAGEEGARYSLHSCMLLSISAILLLLFMAIERRASSPLLPLPLLRVRNFVLANLAAALWSAAVLAWNVVVALYLQRVLGFGPVKTGLMFLPTSAFGVLVALFVAPKLVVRFGFKMPVVLGFLFSAAGLIHFALTLNHVANIGSLLVGMLLMGLGTGAAYSPLLLGALEGVPNRLAGAASGIINSSLVMGGTAGLTALMSTAAGRTTELLTTGTAVEYALTAGYRAVFVAAAAFTAFAMILCLFARNRAVVS